MTLGNKIAALRKEFGLTQEGLAQKLEVTNQSVSKWESDQCCPDIQLLPKIADIFGVTIDALFGREAPAAPTSDLPWEDDGVLRAVLFAGRTLIAGHKAAQNIRFEYEGPALNIHSDFSVTCGSVGGSINAGGSVTCDSVGGSINAGENVTCDSIGGSVTAGGNITCDDIDGNAQAGGDITCDTLEGDAYAGGDIRCDEINGGTVTAGGDVYCDHMEY